MKTGMYLKNKTTPKVRDFKVSGLKVPTPNWLTQHSCTLTRACSFTYVCQPHILIPSWQKCIYMYVPCIPVPILMNFNLVIKQGSWWHRPAHTVKNKIGATWFRWSIYKSTFAKFWIPGQVLWLYSNADPQCTQHPTASRFWINNPSVKLIVYKHAYKWICSLPWLLLISSF